MTMTTRGERFGEYLAFFPVALYYIGDHYLSINHTPHFLYSR
jgi:hypothetical protein